MWKGKNKTKCNFKILVFRCFFARASFCQTNVTWQENLCKALHVLPGQIAQQILVGRHTNKSSWISLSNIFGDLIILQMWEREQPAPCRSSCSFFSRAIYRAINCSRDRGGDTGSGNKSWKKDKSIAAHLWELDAFVSADGCDWKVSYWPEKEKSVLVIGESYQTDQSEAHNQGEILWGARHQKWPQKTKPTHRQAVL